MQEVNVAFASFKELLTKFILFIIVCSVFVHGSFQSLWFHILASAIFVTTIGHQQVFLMSL